MLIEQPCELGAGEIRIEQQAVRAEISGSCPSARRRRKRRGAPVLPDDGGRDGFAGLRDPTHGGFALIRDADCNDVARRELRLSAAHR
jgi:hypothetical protein